MGVVVWRYIDFLILLIPTPLVSVLFCSNIPTFCSIFLNVFRSCFWYVFVIKLYVLNIFYTQYKHIRATTGVPRRPYEGLHIMFYTRRSTQKLTLHILRWTSAVCLQGEGCISRSRGHALYRNASRTAHVKSG